MKLWQLIYISDTLYGHPDLELFFVNKPTAQGLIEATTGQTKEGWNMSTYSIDCSLSFECAEKLISNGGSSSDWPEWALTEITTVD